MNLLRPPIALALVALIALAGCAVGPDYRRPETAVPAAFKEAQNWKAAEPRDEAPVSHWWEVYRDPLLNDLVAQVALSNQNVIAAEAQYRQATALLGQAQASFFPSVSAGLSETRGRAQSSAPLLDNDRLSLNASWEADVWGRIRRNVESGQAGAEASAADLRAALLSAQAALVQAYLQLRVVDAERRLIEQTVVGYERSLQITRNRYEAGVAARLDVTQAEAQFKSTQAQAIDLGVQRAQLEHAIAVLLGKTPADFALTATDGSPVLPGIPATLPSTLLERRPDIAAAERRAAAANASIGVAQSAYFPAISLGGSLGYQNSGLAGLLTAPNRFWTLGPSLALTLFDGGARAAQKEQAIAAYDRSVASYRQTVLSAFQDVEDNLATLRILEQEALVQQQAAKAAAESLTLATNQYRAGTVSYLNVVTAQATTLSADITTLGIAGRRLMASVGLMKALGGDWQGTAPPRIGSAGE
jgi:NodT family efflux transporter outer membrane factor (OMF) lipoprotein